MDSQKPALRLAFTNPAKGMVLHLYDKHKKIVGEKLKEIKIAEIVIGKNIRLEKDISPIQESEAMFIANNLKASHRSSNTREKVNFYVSAEDRQRLTDAYHKAKKLGLEFNPAQRMYDALLEELDVVEKNQLMLKKRINDRGIFAELQKFGDDGFKIFTNIAKERYGKDPLKTNPHSISLYIKGAGSPTAWEFSVALETLVECGRNIFRLGLHFKEIIKLWFDGNKAQRCDLEQLIEEFIEIFKPEKPDEVESLMTDWYTKYKQQQEKF